LTGIKPLFSRTKHGFFYNWRVVLLSAIGVLHYWDVNFLQVCCNAPSFGCGTKTNHCRRVVILWKGKVIIQSCRSNRPYGLGKFDHHEIKILSKGAILGMFDCFCDAPLHSSLGGVSAINRANKDVITHKKGVAAMGCSEDHVIMDQRASTEGILHRIHVKIIFPQGCW